MYTIDELKSDEVVVVASVSGGKDSTAMCLHLKELGIPYQAVHMETGWENAATYEYLAELPKYIGPIQSLRAEVKLDEDQVVIAQRFEERMGVDYSAMIRLVIKKGMFPSRQIRFCTQELKIFPMAEHLHALIKQGLDPINAVGIRAGESKARAKMPEWEESETFRCSVWRPIHSWSEQDVIDIHTRHGVIPNRNYLQGAERVGCWPCIFARKSEIQHLANSDPARIDLLEDLETAVWELATARALARGEEPGSKPSWFQQRNPTRSKAPCNKCEGLDPSCKRCKGTGTYIRRDGSCMPIREVVEWSRTARGGRQYEIFAAAGREAGCVRWGLCDVPTDKGGE